MNIVVGDGAATLLKGEEGGQNINQLLETTYFFKNPLSLLVLSTENSVRMGEHESEYCGPLL
jgi:hypothetical protein